MAGLGNWSCWGFCFVFATIGPPGLFQGRPRPPGGRLRPGLRGGRHALRPQHDVFGATLPPGGRLQPQQLRRLQLWTHLLRSRGWKCFFFSIRLQLLRRMFSTCFCLPTCLSMRSADVQQRGEVHLRQGLHRQGLQRLRSHPQAHRPDGPGEKRSIPQTSLHPPLFRCPPSLLSLSCNPPQPPLILHRDSWPASRAQPCWTSASSSWFCYAALCAAAAAAL